MRAVNNNIKFISYKHKQLVRQFRYTYKPFKVQIVTFKSVQCHPGLTYIFNF